MSRHKLPQGCTPMAHQVAGHTFQEGSPHDIGLLKPEGGGVVLKPAGKTMCGQREIAFYESLRDAQPEDGDLLGLRELVPKFHGVERLEIEGREVTFLKLEDLTDRMFEPCVMDIKIGRRTWDPLATAEKQRAEEGKYAECKRALGLCVPGFQVHSVKTGKCKRYGKEYGKTLNATTFRDTLRLFLNGESGLCANLIVHMLTGLWAIQKWARAQRSVRVYSSSVLLVYDARRLRTVLEAKQRTRFRDEANGGEKQQGAKRSVSNDSGQIVEAAAVAENGEPVPSFKKIQRNHSTSNDYDQDIKQIHADYVFQLDSLMNETAEGEERTKWANVRMIDFAHLFPRDDGGSGGDDSDGGVDQNYLFGIENLVRLFEQLLEECDKQ